MISKTLDVKFWKVEPANLRVYAKESQVLLEYPVTI